MPYIKTIIAFIDTEIKKSLNDVTFQGRQYGLASAMVTDIRGGDLKIIMPAVVKTDGEMDVVFPDDRYNFTSYHSLVSNGFAPLSQQQQYGDGRNMIKEISEMTMTVTALTNRVKLTVDQIEGIMMGAFPDRGSNNLLAETKFSSIFIAPYTSRFDSQKIFDEEYRSSGYTLIPSQVLLQIKYRIESVFRKDCFKNCAPC